MNDQHELAGILKRLFPSFRDMPLEAAAQRAEGLGLFAAKTWSVGPEGLAARGIEVPAAVHAPLAQVAPRVVQAQTGGATFLQHVRKGLGDDAAFGRLLVAYAGVWAESLRKASDVGAVQPPPARPEPAPAPTPAPAAAPAPAPAPAEGQSALDFALSGDLDFADEPARAAPPRPAPAPAPVRSAGDLDLSPPAERPAGGGLDLDLSAPPEDDPRARLRAEGLELTQVEDSAPKRTVQELMIDQTRDARAGQAEDELAPRDPADRALWYFERYGAQEDLTEAVQAYGKQLAEAPHAVAAAAAEAGLARAALVAGNAAEAERRAKSAQARDPSNPYATQVLLRLARGEAQLAPFRLALARMRGVMQDRAFAEATSMAHALAKQVPTEPHPWLVLAMLGRFSSDERLFLTSLAKAWQLWPGDALKHEPLGGELDVDVGEVLTDYGLAPEKQNDPEEMRKTYEDVDSKENLVGGALRMAVGMAHLALFNSQAKTQDVERRLTMVAAQGLVGLQYYDAALPYFGKAGCLGPTPEQSKRIADERIRAGALRRAFDRPGIKAQLKDYRCPSVPLIRAQLEEELKWAREELQRREDELCTLGPKLHEQLQRDPAMRDDVAAGADTCRIKDPYQVTVEAAEKIKELEQQLEELGSAEAPKAGGLFGKIKAVAASAASQVGEAKLKKQIASAKQALIRSKRDLAKAIACDMSDHTFKSPVLVGFARRGEVFEAFSDALSAEIASLTERLQRVDQIGKRG
ncbi:MAG: hypothetical protein R3F62_19115 [Planctomycetota bacterium]